MKHGNDTTGLLEPKMPPKKQVDTSTYMGRIAVRLRMLREGAGLTVDELSAKLVAAGVQAKSRAVYAWEQGQNPVHLAALPVLAKLYKLKSPGDVLPPK